MKIIFLDIDGVLQPYDNNERFEHNLEETVKEVAVKYNDTIYFTMDPYDVAAVYYDWDGKAVGLLKTCLDETDATPLFLTEQIILSKMANRRCPQFCGIFISRER